MNDTDKDVHPFEIYPAIDLRAGRVVRLRTGDPKQQTTYSISPGHVARDWFTEGAKWLHVVNLDGAFGSASQANLAAAEKIVKVAQEFGAQVQYGGGIRTLEAMENAFSMGVTRVVLGTVLVETPEILKVALDRWRSEQIVAGIDVRDGMVQVRGWQKDGGIKAIELAQRIADQGLTWMVYTDIARDGTGNGANLVETAAVAQASGLQVIASGGFDRPLEILQAKSMGLAGVILGRSLYEGKIQLGNVLEIIRGGEDAGETNHSLS